MNFPEAVPLVQDSEGTIRVTGSRVTLDTLVAVFEKGNTPAQISEGFPSVSLEQIEAAIGWYLNHQAEAKEYLQQQNAEAEKLRQEIESQPEHAAVRKKLLRRRELLIKT